MGICWNNGESNVQEKGTRNENYRRLLKAGPFKKVSAVRECVERRARSA